VPLFKHHGYQKNFLNLNISSKRLLSSGGIFRPATSFKIFKQFFRSQDTRRLKSDHFIFITSEITWVIRGKNQDICMKIFRSFNYLCNSFTSWFLSAQISSSCDCCALFVLWSKVTLTHFGVMLYWTCSVGRAQSPSAVIQQAPPVHPGRLIASKPLLIDKNLLLSVHSNS